MIGLGRRPLLMMLLGWVAVVGAVGAITFVVVSDAGSGVGRASAAERVVVVSPEVSDSTTTTRTPTPPGTPTSPGTPTPSASPRPASPSDLPEPRSTSRAPRPSAPSVDPHTASFTTQGGIVVASCRRSRVVLDSIRPRDGWRYEQELTRGALEVKFKANEREVEIYLRCVDEVPTRLKPGSHWGAGDFTSPESSSPPLVRPTDTVQSESSHTPSPTAPSTEETPHD